MSYTKHPKTIINDSHTLASHTLAAHALNGALKGFEYCLKTENIGALRILFKNRELDIIPDIFWDNYFMDWCITGNFEMAHYLYEETFVSIDLHIDDEFPLQACCRGGYFDFAKWLYDQAPSVFNIHAKNEYALKWAVIGNHIDIAKWLYSLDPTGFDLNSILNDVKKLTVGMTNQTIGWLIDLFVDEFIEDPTNDTNLSSNIDSKINRIVDNHDSVVFENALKGFEYCINNDHESAIKLLIKYQKTFDHVTANNLFDKCIEIEKYELANIFAEYISDEYWNTSIKKALFANKVNAYQKIYELDVDRHIDLEKLTFYVWYNYCNIVEYACGKNYHEILYWIHNIKPEMITAKIFMSMLTGNTSVCVDSTKHLLEINPDLIKTVEYKHISYKLRICDFETVSLLLSKSNIICENSFDEFRKDIVYVAKKMTTDKGDILLNIVERFRGDDKKILDELLPIYCQIGNIDQIKKLIVSGADPRFNNNAAFENCCLYNRLDIAKWLYNKYIMTIDAIRANNDKIFIALCKRQSDSDLETILWICKLCTCYSINISRQSVRRVQPFYRFPAISIIYSIDE